MSFSDLQEIKRKLLDENRVEDLLSSIGCEYISYEGNQRVTAQLPDRFYSNNKRAVQVKLDDSLYSSIRNKPDFKGDIFNLVSYIHFDIRGDLQEDLNNAKKFVCETFGWTQFLKGEKGFIAKQDYVAPLREILKGKKRKKEVKPNPVMPESTLDEFYYKGRPIPYQEWIDEGISYKTQMMYGVGFCLESKRVVFPLRNRFGQLVGIKGRIMKDDDDPESKYLYLYRCNNRYEWFNFHFAHPYILMEKKVYIFESEKSSMKAFDYGIYNTLSIGASEISEEQAQMVKQLGLDVEIVLCYDKGLSREDIERGAELFKGRKVMAMIDTDDLLPNKSAPIDEGIEIWNKLKEDHIIPLVV